MAGPVEQKAGRLAVPLGVNFDIQCRIQENARPILQRRQKERTVGIVEETFD